MSLEINGVIVPDEDKEIYDYFGIRAACPADVKSAIDEAGGDPLLSLIHISEPTRLQSIS